MFCGFGEEECKKWKKKKKLNATKSVGRDEKASYNILPCEIFFAVLKSFLNKTAFYQTFEIVFRS